MAESRDQAAGGARIGEVATIVDLGHLLELWFSFGEFAAANGMGPAQQGAELMIVQALCVLAEDPAVSDEEIDVLLAQTGASRASAIAAARQVTALIEKHHGATTVK